VADAGQAGLSVQEGVSQPLAAPRAGAVAGRIAARIDRLPLTRVQWQLALLVELAWGVIIVDTDGIAGRLYPFVWRPHHWVTTVQYAVIQAFEVGLGVLIGDLLMSYVANRYGRRLAIVLSAVLAGVFIWPFAFVTDFGGLIALSIFSTLGVGAIVATHSVYISEIVSPEARNTLLLGSQGITALVSVVSGILAYLWIPSQWQLFVYVMAAFQLLFLFPLLAWRLPESPRWLEAQGRYEEAERELARLEALCERAYGRPLPEPDPRPHPVIMAGHGLGGYGEIFGDARYRGRALLLLVAWFFGYAGIVYGVGAFSSVYMADHGASPHFVFALVTVAGLFRFLGFLANALLGERFERRDVILVLSVVFTLAWLAMFLVPAKPAMAVFYTIGGIGASLWLFNMYNYTAVSFPTRLRALAFGATDGLGHIGAWIGISLMGFMYLMGPNHLGWIAFITIPGALIPSLLVRGWGIRQRAAVLEQVSA
jgi:MFS family permease